MALALVLFCLCLGAQATDLTLTAQLNPRTLPGCTVKQNYRYFAGGYMLGSAGEIISTEDVADVDGCFFACQFQKAGCVMANFKHTAPKECTLYKTYYVDSGGTNTDYTAMSCKDVFLGSGGTNGVELKAASGDSTVQASLSTVETHLCDWNNDTSSVWKSENNAASPIADPNDFTWAVAPYVAATLADPYLYFQISAQTAVSTALPHDTHSVEVWPVPGVAPGRFTRIRLRFPAYAFFTTGQLDEIQRVQLIWNVGDPTAASFGTPWTTGEISLDNSIPYGQGLIMDIALQDTDTVNLTSLEATPNHLMVGLRVLGLRASNLAPVAPTITTPVEISDIAFYMSATHFKVPFSSSAHSSSSAYLSSSSAPYSSSSAPAPPPLGPVCSWAAGCYSILRQNCTASGPCGACIPGKYGSPPPSNANDCCNFDCAALHRVSCTSGGGYCGDCLLGWRPDFANQVQDQDVHSQACIPMADVNGGWSPWFSCDRPCGGGRRFRTCSDPLPLGNGAPCIGMDVSNCNLQPCPNDQAADPCLRTPPTCLNGATCVSWVDGNNACGYGHTCQCPIGYTGVACETDAVNKAVSNILKSIQDASAFQRYYFPDARTAANLQWAKPRPGEEWGDHLDRRISRLEDEGFAGYGSPEELRHWALFHQPGRFGPYPIIRSSTGGLPRLQDVIDALLYPTSGKTWSSSAPFSSSSAPNFTESSSSEVASSSTSGDSSSTGHVSSSTGDESSSTGDVSSSTGDVSSSTGDVSSSTGDESSSTGDSSTAAFLLEQSSQQSQQPHADNSQTPTTLASLLAPIAKALANPVPPPLSPVSAPSVVPPPPTYPSLRQVQKTLNPPTMETPSPNSLSLKRNRDQNDNDNHPVTFNSPVTDMSSDEQVKIRAREALQEASEEAAASPFSPDAIPSEFLEKQTKTISRFQSAEDSEISSSPPSLLSSPWVHIGIAFLLSLLCAAV